MQLIHRHRDPLPLPNMQALPSSLSEVRQIAAKVFLDPAAVSVNIETTFGNVLVTRDMEITMA